MGRLSTFLCLALFVLAASAQKKKRPGKEDGKIIGGQSARISSFPYQVSIQTTRGQHFCGGSIISTRHILTAAHCVDDQSASSMQVVTGKTNLSDQGGQTRRVARVTPHPAYNRRNTDNDIAVIELASPLTITKDGVERIIALDHSEFSPRRSTDHFIVSGWGLTREGVSTSRANTLQYVRVPGVSRATCARRYASRGFEVTNNMVCAGYDEGGKDACQGDSGGPAISSVSGRQAGVVSWGVGCARAGLPGVYTNVANYIPWIRSVTGVSV